MNNNSTHASELVKECLEPHIKVEILNIRDEVEEEYDDQEWFEVEVNYGDVKIFLKDVLIYNVKDVRIEEEYAHLNFDIYEEIKPTLEPIIVDLVSTTKYGYMLAVDSSNFFDLIVDKLETVCMEKVESKAYE